MKEDVVEFNFKIHEPTMFIMRGLPGSGKSTLAKKIADMHNAVICSADDFFMKDGVYVFDRSLLHQAHLTCQNKAREALKQGKHVVIDNTNVRQREINVYIAIAQEFNAFVAPVQSNTPWAFDVNECFKRNTHNVPLEVIQRMKDEWYELGMY